MYCCTFYNYMPCRIRFVCLQVNCWYCTVLYAEYTVLTTVFRSRAYDTRWSYTKKCIMQLLIYCCCFLIVNSCKCLQRKGTHALTKYVLIVYGIFCYRRDAIREYVKSCVVHLTLHYIIRYTCINHKVYITYGNYT